MNAIENTVLIIDDDEINLMVARTVLEKKLPCKVLTADNGLDGFNLLMRQSVNVVLLDIEMPHMDGFDTLQYIRSDDKTKNLPVIMLTAVADEETVIRAAAYNVDGYIKKPFMPEDLIERVRSYLDIL